MMTSCDLAGGDAGALERGADGDRAELGRGERTTSAPRNLPIGVRAAETMTGMRVASGMGEM